MNINSVLPAEILERIFSLVAPRVLRAVVLVCRRWREVGEAACLWSRTRLTVVDSNMALMPEVLGSRRLRSLRRLTLKAVSPQLLETVAVTPVCADSPWQTPVSVGWSQGCSVGWCRASRR